MPSRQFSNTKIIDQDKAKGLTKGSLVSFHLFQFQQDSSFNQWTWKEGTVTKAALLQGLGNSMQ